MKPYHHLHQTDEYSHKLPGAISRRRFIALAIATFVTGCAPSSQSTSHPPGKSAASPTSTPTIILLPRERINPGNASRVVQLAKLDPGDVEVKSIAWSPDAGLFAAGAYNDIQFWDPKTGKEVAILRGHSGLIWSIAWAPNGQLLASASDDGTVRIWDARKYTVHNILRAHSDMVLSVGWSPDGSRLITGNIDGTLELWDASNGKNLAVWKGHAPENSGKSGIWALAVTNDIGSVQLWDAQTGKNVALLKGHPEAGWPTRLPGLRMGACSLLHVRRARCSSGMPNWAKNWLPCKGTKLKYGVLPGRPMDSASFQGAKMQRSAYGECPEDSSSMKALECLRNK